MAILDQYGYPCVPQKYAHSADRNYARGVVYRELTGDIDKLITASDAKSIRSLASRLYTNVGVIKAACDDKADYSVGDAWLPTYVGESDFEDGKQIANFMRKVWFPNCNVKGGVFDWHKTLELASIAIDRDGDQYWLKIIGKDGFPRLQVIPAHRIGNGPDGDKVKEGKFKDYKISDGVIVMSSGKPVAYRILTGERMDGYEDVDAANIIPILDPDFAEQNRGISKFNHALQDLSACLSSTEDERIRQQIVSRLHLTIFNAAGGPDPDDPLNSIQTTTDINGDEKKLMIQRAPGGIVYMEAGGKEKIEQLAHNTPGDMWENFQDRMIRMSLGPVWPYGLVWKGAGQGTDSRADVVKARRRVTKRIRDLRRPALTAYAWAYSVFKQANRVPLLDHPFSWKFSKPPRISVDDGRESKLELEEWRAGIRNTGEIAESRGLTEEELTLERAYSVGNRKGIAYLVGIELSKKYGTEIEIHDREMALLTANDMGDTPSTADAIEGETQYDEDGNEIQSDSKQMARFDTLKSKFDAYGVAVRAGAITPSEADEVEFRKEAGLPAMTSAVKGAWKEDEGFRRPITLLQKVAAAAGFSGQPSQPTQK